MNVWLGGSGLRGIGGALGIVLLGATGACGPMPGYVDPDRQVASAPTPPTPAAPPARLDEADDDVDDEDGSVVESEDLDADERRDLAPEPPARYEPPARTAPRYEPPAPTYEPPARTNPPRYERAPTPGAPGPYVPPREVPASPSQAGGIRKITIDDDTYYLLDPARKLCFLRHRETMTSIDCTKIPEARDFVTPTPIEPARTPERIPAPEPVRQPSRIAPSPEPEPTPEPSRSGGPSPDEIARFEGAFVDIFCDRKGGEDVAPEDRIRDRGLSVERYEALESWWAADEKAWWNLTDKARKACPQR